MREHTSAVSANIIHKMPVYMFLLFFVLLPILHMQRAWYHTKIKMLPKTNFPTPRVHHLHHLSRPHCHRPLTNDPPPATPSHNCQDELPLNTPPLLAVSVSSFLVLFLNARSTSFRVRRGFLGS